MEQHRLNIGTLIKIGRSFYTILTEFEDTYKRTFDGKIVTEHLYVGKKMINDFPTYSHIIMWNEHEKKWMLRT